MSAFAGLMTSDAGWSQVGSAATGGWFSPEGGLHGVALCDRQVVTLEQYSFLVAVVITSAVIPTAIATCRFFPRHLLQTTDLGETSPVVEGGETDFDDLRDE